MKKINAIIAMLLVTSSIHAQSFKLKLEKGMKFEVNTSTKTSSSSNSMGQEINISNELFSKDLFEVKEVESNTIELMKTVTKISFSFETMGQSMSYDSDKKENPSAVAEKLDMIKNKIKIFTIDDEGKIIKSNNNFDDLSNIGLMSPSKEEFPLYISSVTGKEIKVGNSWNDSTTNLVEKTQTTVAGTYTILAVNNDTKTTILQFKGTQKLAGSFEQNGLEMKLIGTNKINSEFEIDLATGILNKSTTQIEGTSTTEVSSMSIPANVKIAISTSVKKIL